MYLFIPKSWQHYMGCNTTQYYNQAIQRIQQTVWTSNSPEQLLCVGNFSLVLYTWDSDIHSWTNLYAEQCLGDRFSSLNHVTVHELEAYFGFMILMGIVKLPALGDYWKIDPVFHYHPIVSRISRNRFLDIHRFLHFVNNRELPSYGEENYNKLQKVKTILTRLKQRYLDLFIQDRIKPSMRQWWNLKVDRP